MRLFIASTFLCLTIAACDSGADPSDASLGSQDAGLVPDSSAGTDAAAEPSPECNIVAPTACEQPAPTYADVEPIFQERCVGCHVGQAGGPWPLTTYPHVKSWADDIRAAMLNCEMPPPDSGETMPDAERDRLLVWLRCGAPP